MSDRAILDKLASIPREMYVARDELYKVWFSEDRPKETKSYRYGDFFF